jgi:uncharacterized protein
MPGIKVIRAMTTASDNIVNELPRAQLPVLLLAGTAVVLTTWLVQFEGWHQVRLYSVGLVMGLVLFHAAFGFTGSWRRMMVQRQTAGVEAQLLMLGLATLLFAPALANGSLWGTPVAGAVAPLGLQVVAGALLFGLGMQLGGGCGSGTLFTVGGGSPRMIVTLLAFCGGSFWASLDMHWWVNTPRLPGIALGDIWGWPLAAAAQLLILAGLWLLLRRWRLRPEDEKREPMSWRQLLQGPWFLWWGAVALAVLNWLTLGLSGHPWTITWGFTLWGAKAATLVGWSPVGNWFWTGGFTENALTAPVLADETTAMNIGIMAGAFLAAGLAGRFTPGFRIPLRSLAAAVIGGLMMGYGARIGFGCNIGALFSGIASTSLHGWMWAAFALGGTWIGIQVRPWFALSKS